MSHRMVSKPVVDGLGSSVPLVADDAVVHGAFNPSLSYVPSEIQGDLKTTVSGGVNSSPTIAHVDCFTTALLAQQLATPSS